MSDCHVPCQTIHDRTAKPFEACEPVIIRALTPDDADLGWEHSEQTATYMSCTPTPDDDRRWQTKANREHARTKIGS